jgi:hypothetical protein
MKTLLCPSSAWAERYEALRRHVVGGGGELLETQPLGLALWLAKGMAGWMRQWSQLTELTPLPSRATLPLSCRSTGPWQHQLTLLLAQMTLEHLQPQGSP